MLVGSGVGVDQLPGGRHTDCRTVEREFFCIPHKMKEMRMTAAELLRAVDAKRVIPDDPASADEAQFVLKDQLQFCRILIADGQPKGPVLF